jgi:integrase/recombinase XerD
MVVVRGVHVVGPLEPYAEGLACELARLGFTELSAGGQLRLAAHLSRVAGRAGTRDGGAGRPGCRPVPGRAPRSWVYGVLVAKGAASGAGLPARPGRGAGAERPRPVTAAAELLEAYREYLLGERGVQADVARGYLYLVRPFVERHAADGIAGLRGLAAGDVTVFLTAQSRRLAPKNAQRLATALRSLLRFWHRPVREPADQSPHRRLLIGDPVGDRALLTWQRRRQHDRVLRGIHPQMDQPRL